MNDAIREQLVLGQQNHEIVAIYNFATESTFSVGRVIAMDPLFVLIIGLDMEAKINGIQAIRIASIQEVRRQTDYLLNVQIREQVAKQHGYYDIWHIEDDLRINDFKHGSILVQMLTEAYQKREPVVIGTKKFKDRDDFDGLIADLSAIQLVLHYLDFEDLSSLWERDILLADIDYLRVKGMQAHNSQAILREVFDEPK